MFSWSVIWNFVHFCLKIPASRSSFMVPLTALISRPQWNLLHLVEPFLRLRCSQINSEFAHRSAAIRCPLMTSCRSVWPTLAVGYCTQQSRGPCTCMHEPLRFPWFREVGATSVVVQLCYEMPLGGRSRSKTGYRPNHTRFIKCTLLTKHFIAWISVSKR